MSDYRLEKMDIADLKALRAKLNQRIASRNHYQKKKTIKQIQKHIQQYRLTPEILFPDQHQ